MKTIFGWLVARDGENAPGSYTLLAEEAAALRCARDRAIATDAAHNVYKVIQTHHVKRPVTVIEAVE